MIQNAHRIIPRTSIDDATETRKNITQTPNQPGYLIIESPNANAQTSLS